LINGFQDRTLHFPKNLILQDASIYEPFSIKRWYFADANANSKVTYHLGVLCTNRPKVQDPLSQEFS